MAATAPPNFTLSSNHYMSHSKFSHSKTYTPLIIRSSSSFPALCYNRQKPVMKLSDSSGPLPLFIPSPPPKHGSNFFVEKVVTILLGSLVFMGCLKTRPVLANPVQVSERFEDKSAEKSGRSNGAEDEEEIMCAKLLQGNPKSIESLKMVVNVKMKKGKPSEALKYVEKLIELQPNEVQWRVLQAICYEMIGDLSKARSLFKIILEQRPLLIKALHGLAMVMHKNREGPAVFVMLEKAMKLAREKRRVDEERNIRMLTAEMHLIKGNYEEALDWFQDLIDEDPKDFRPHLCQGIAYSLLDRRKEAEESFEMYRSLVSEEFPQRGFLDDVVLSAKIKP